jgi:hypothetical protein
MTKPHTAVADTTLAPRPSSSGGPASGTFPLRQGASSSNETDNYKPLPIGNWTLPFHGNCPRCHHHHEAVQVRIKITRAPGEMSYIHCDKCESKWAGFGDRNSTQISLLSSATTETDSIETAVRYKLIDIVKIASAKATLQTLSEVTNLGTSSPSSTAKEALDLSAPGQTLTTSSKHQDTGLITELVSTPPCSTRAVIVARQRSTLSRLLSRAKVRLSARIPMLHRDHAQQTKESLRPSSSHTKHINNSTVPNSLAADEGPIAGLEACVEPHIREISDDLGSVLFDKSNGTAAKPVGRMAEVADFIRSLDTTVLDSMNDTEREMWMRKNYSKFKARNKKSTAPLGLSPIVESSVSNEPPRSLERIDRRSTEVFGAGAHVNCHIEGLGSIETPLRRTSLVISEGTSDDPLSSDDSTFVNTVVSTIRNTAPPRLEQLRRGMNVEQPHSMPNASRLPRRGHQRGRGSLDSRGVPLWSQNSPTIHGSTASLQRTWSEEAVQQYGDLEGADSESADQQPPLSALTQNHRASSPPPLTPRESSELVRVH